MLTPEVRRLQRQLSEELYNAAETQGLTRKEAEPALASIMADVYAGAESLILSRLPKGADEDSAHGLAVE